MSRSDRKTMFGHFPTPPRRWDGGILKRMLIINELYISMLKYIFSQIDLNPLMGGQLGT